MTASQHGNPLQPQLACRLLPAHTHTVRQRHAHRHPDKKGCSLVGYQQGTVLESGPRTGAPSVHARTPLPSCMHGTTTAGPSKARLLKPQSTCVGKRCVLAARAFVDTGGHSAQKVLTTQRKGQMSLHVCVIVHLPAMTHPGSVCD